MFKLIPANSFTIIIVLIIIIGIIIIIITTTKSIITVINVVVEILFIVIWFQINIASCLFCLFLEVMSLHMIIIVVI